MSRHSLCPIVVTGAQADIEGKIFTSTLENVSVNKCHVEELGFSVESNNIQAAKQTAVLDITLLPGGVVRIQIAVMGDMIACVKFISAKVDGAEISLSGAVRPTGQMILGRRTWKYENY